VIAILKATNLGLAFLLELCMLVALGYWGFTVVEPTLLKFLLGLGVPAVAIVVWGWLLAPKSVRRLHQPWLLIAKIIIFGLAAVALYFSGQVIGALVLGGLAAVNLGLGQLWKQE
jgi:Protein of unknown function (DUF2568)